MQQRSVLRMIILTIVTLGIYQLFWTYWTNQEMRAKGARVLPVRLLFTPLIVFVFVALLQFVVRLALSQSESSGGSILINFISLVAGVFALLAVIPITLYWYYRYCQALESVTEKQITFGFGYGLLILCYIIGVSFIWPFIIQYRLNEIFSGPSVTDTPYPAA